MESLICTSWHSHWGLHSKVHSTDYQLSYWLLRHIHAKQVIFFLGHIHCLFFLLLLSVIWYFHLFLKRIFCNSVMWLKMASLLIHMHRGSYFSCLIWFSFSHRGVLRDWRLINIDFTFYAPALGYVLHS